MGHSPTSGKRLWLSRFATGPAVQAEGVLGQPGDRRKSRLLLRVRPAIALWRAHVRSLRGGDRIILGSYCMATGPSCYSASQAGGLLGVSRV
ncbi:hypothetical protein AVEN_217881-1 [Araneus ventricosus]|uniref:Uncharacterized protein n=1 Tax=Araneus ventricosus TaxID=182803 RepID=A0A4Y2RQI3_ARAVE|nr:hypothetical protein AVEN_217881-1 [Araneus ventricosus]